jgi:hypothetical protein
MRVITIIDSALITIIDSEFQGWTKYRWPLLFSLGRGDRAQAVLCGWRDRMPSPPPNPGDVAAKPMAKTH